MKPNDKAIEAEAVREVKSILNTISPVTDNETIAQNIVGKIIAAYAAQFPSSEEYAVLIRELRMRPHRRGYETEDEAKVRRQKEREEAADALEAVLAERDALKAANNELREENELVGKQMDRFADQIEALEAERDALLARLAPVEDDALVEIAAREIAFAQGDVESPNSEFMDENWHCWEPEARAAIAAIRPHIEATERERCAKIAETPELWLTDKPSRGCDDIAAAIRRKD